MSSRRKAREFALQLLFQQDLSQGKPDQVLSLFWQVNPTSDSNREFAELLFRHTCSNLDRIDELIGRHTQHWRMERMAAVDRNILRMAVAEFLYSDTPSVVAIDEAIEIARRFSTAESSLFVNGVLDAVRADLATHQEEGSQDG